MIPPKMGRALAQLHPSRIKFAEVPGAGHNNIVQMALLLNLQAFAGRDFVTDSG
jgi:hypothetical protein